MNNGTLGALCAGNIGLARIIANGYPKGETIYINTGTAPTPSGEHIMKATIKSRNGNTIITEECEPYFGYNTFSINDIVG